MKESHSKMYTLYTKFARTQNSSNHLRLYTKREKSILALFDARISEEKNATKLVTRRLRNFKIDVKFYENTFRKKAA